LMGNLNESQLMIIDSGNKQSGAALAISLILLVAMTILGVATLNMTRVAEKVSSNAQQKAIVFETAESVLNSMSSADDFQARLRASRTTNLEPDPVIQTAETNVLNASLDQQNNFGKSVDVTASAEIQFCAEKPKDGTELNADESVNGTIGVQYDTRATSEIANSKAKAKHVRRVSIDGVQFYSVGKCKTPGS